MYFGVVSHFLLFLFPENKGKINDNWGTTKIILYFNYENVVDIEEHN